MFRHPSDDLSSSESYDIICIGIYRIDRGVYWNDGHDALVEERHVNVQPELSCSLIDVAFDSQAILETALNGLDELAFFVVSNVGHFDGGGIASQMVQNSPDHGSFVRKVESNSIRPRSKGISGGISDVLLVVLVPIREHVPSVLYE